MRNKTDYHIPVLLKESIEALQIKPDGIYIDATFGGGSHSRAIYDKLNSGGHLISFDQDADAQENVWTADNFTFIASNFSFIKNHLKLLKIGRVDGVFADLGVSSHQFDDVQRGFSIRSEADLDMRMNQSGEVTAKAVINEYSENDLIRIFREFGEIKNASKLVQKIADARLSSEIQTTSQLVSLAQQCAPKNKENKYLAQVFQAIRIEVNNELGALQDFLMQCEDILKPNGRLVVISYHSLEDRMVKNFMKRGSLSGDIQKDFYGNVIKDFTEVIRHPIVPDENEIDTNKRARSAKLRIAERKG